MNMWKKIKLVNLLNKARKDIMWEKLKKTELWIAVLSSALLTLLTQVGLEPEMAAKLIAMISATYVGSRGLAKVGRDK